MPEPFDPSRPGYGTKPKAYEAPVDRDFFDFAGLFATISFLVTTAIVIAVAHEHFDSLFSGTGEDDAYALAMVLAPGAAAAKVVHLLVRWLGTAIGQQGPKVPPAEPPWDL